MFHQEQQEQKESHSQTANNDGTYVGLLSNGDLYVGTEPPVSGFATEDKTVIEECPFSAVEQPNPLSNLPQTIGECFGHSMWDLSKTCVACGASEYGGSVTSNIPLFRKFNCNFIRACPDHHAMVSAHFSKQDFQEQVVYTLSPYHEIRRCPQCGKNFTAISDSSNSFCNKGCQGNWLDSSFR